MWLLLKCIENSFEKQIIDWFGTYGQFGNSIKALIQSINFLVDRNESNVCSKKIMAKTSKWNPQTSYYDYNYGVGINFYQPMIDYLNERDRGGKTHLPHLPWTDELGLNEYDPKKAIRSYSHQDLSKLSHQTEASAKEKLRDFKSTSKSGFILCKSVEAATITQKVKTEVRKKKGLVREIKKLKSKMQDVDLYPPNDEEIVAALKSSQKYLRGKSAKGIESQLLSESRKNIAECIEHDVKKFQRNMFVNTHDYAGHLRVMDKRMQQQLEDSFVLPLDNLSAELKCFDKKTTSYFIDKR